ncbi:MAG: CopG family ribbon-helix-helix protein [Thermoplasmatota archaeon]
MQVISISLPMDLLTEVEGLQERGYAGRSEAVRAALRHFLQSLREEEDLTGSTSAAVVTSYQEAVQHRIAQVRHDHGDVVRSMLHHHSRSNHDCVESLIVEGDAARVRSLVDALRSQEGIRFAQAVLVSNEHQDVPGDGEEE